jgi:hypothetical protein
VEVEEEDANRCDEEAEEGDSGGKESHLWCLGILVLFELRWFHGGIGRGIVHPADCDSRRSCMMLWTEAITIATHKSK